KATLQFVDRMVPVKLASSYRCAQRQSSKFGIVSQKDLQSFGQRIRIAGRYLITAFTIHHNLSGSATIDHDCRCSASQSLDRNETKRLIHGCENECAGLLQDLHQYCIIDCSAKIHMIRNAEACGKLSQFSFRIARADNL